MSLVDEDPTLARDLDPRRRDMAERALRAVEVQVGTGSWNLEALAPAVRDGLGLLIVDGVVVRRVGHSRRHGAELLGAGDLLRPRREDGPFATSFKVLQPLRIALLDRNFLRAVAVFPEVTAEITGRAVERSRSVLVQMCVAHHPRVDTRLLLLLWHLAERWGRVTSRGVLLPLRLTHSLLADLVAAQRPSVTQAVIGMERDGLLVRETGGIMLLGDPPEELTTDERPLAAVAG